MPLPYPLSDNFPSLISPFINVVKPNTYFIATNVSLCAIFILTLEKKPYTKA